MKELDKDIRTLLEIYFDKKIKNISISDELKDKIWEMVDMCIEDVQDITGKTNREIDNEIEEATADYNEGYYDELTKDNAFRQGELADICREFYFTR